jgi:galactokinase/mevalonate kinase-like predicted kinase
MKLQKENRIRLWVRLDGTLDVTRHRERVDRRLHDVPRDFRNFKTTKEAISYMKNLKKKVIESKEKITEFGLDTFGFEVNAGWGTNPNNDIQRIRDREISLSLKK